MTAAAFALAGQSLAEAQMSDAVTVTRDGGLVTDQTTGVVTEVPVVKYTGKAKIRPEEALQADAKTAGEATDLLDMLLVSIPVSAVDVRTNDTVTVTASVDASLVGASLRVVGVVRGTAITARRLRCRLDFLGE